MKTVELAQATEALSEYARRAKREGLVVTLRGKPMATVMALPAGSDWETLAIGTNPKFLEIMECSRQAHRAQGGIFSRPDASGIWNQASAHARAEGSPRSLDARGTSLPRRIAAHAPQGGDRRHCGRP